MQLDGVSVVTDPEERCERTALDGADAVLSTHQHAGTVVRLMPGVEPRQRLLAVPRAASGGGTTCPWTTPSGPRVGLLQTSGSSPIVIRDARQRRVG